MAAAPRLSPLLLPLATLVCCPADALPAEPVPQARPLPTISAGTPLADLLPAAPKVSKAPVYLGDDLERVPEVQFEAPPAELSKGANLTTPKWISRKARTAAAVLYLNSKGEDGFLKALVRSRPDLSGLPFLMGEDCRTEEARASVFKYVAQQVQRGAGPGPYLLVRYQRAHIAVMAQKLVADDGVGQPRVLRALTSTRRPEATRELARAAVFSPDESLRAKALKALGPRPAEEATEVLVAGLRYPWPAVARNAARAIAQLRRVDLVPQLKAALDEPDPRGPRQAVAGGREVTVAREVVRVNHLRNCLLCHAPAEPGKTQDGALVAEVPLPSEPLPQRGAYFDDPRSPARLANLLVRIDVTYLRQDFSAMGAVPGAAPWPTQQRFDFVVRQRVLTPGDAADLRKRLEGESPYRRAAAQALRELTGRDFRGKPSS
jgi:hypothetical protein